MRESLSIGATPANEPCMQLGAPDYDPIKARQECQRFIDLIRKTVGPEPEGARLRVSSESCGWGTYHEVEVVYTTDEGAEYAYRVESEAPTRWE